VLGIDLGAYAVKVTEAEVGFRTTKLLSYTSVPVPQGPEPVLLRSLKALRAMELVSEQTLTVAVGFPGDRVLLRLLDIPFTEAKKVAAVVGNELADDIPWELEDVIYDFSILADPQGLVLAATAQSKEIGEVLRELSEMGIVARSLSVSPLAYGGLVRHLGEERPVGLVDIGHQRTNVCLVKNGRVAMARTLSRAGAHLTEAFRQTFQLSSLQAESLKEQQAFFMQSDGNLPPGAGSSSNPQQIALVTEEAMAPLLREVALTMGLFMAKLGQRAERLLLCGGTSLIPGIEGRLQAETHLPVERLQLDLGSEAPAEERPVNAPREVTGALSLGIAMEQSGRRNIDLRQGEFAYRVDRSIFREKLVFLAVSLVAVLVFAAFNAYLSLYALRKEEKTLKLQLNKAVMEVLGTKMASPRRISREVTQGCKAKALGIPQKSAFDVFDMISTQVPPAEKVKLDVSRLDIKPGKTYLKGTADSRSAIGDIVKALEKNPCFSKVASGTISEVAEGKKQFTLTVTTECF
jgi:general secretion pathway protein L